MTRLLLMGVGLLLLCGSLACGVRAVGVNGDSGIAPDSSVGLADSSVQEPDAAGPCRTPDSCSSDSDCDTGFVCGGCFGDPCCPACAACAPQCISSGAQYCSELSSRYFTKLAESQQCSPALDVEQCLYSVPSEFRCPCSVSVNSAAAVTELNALRQLYVTAGCLGDETWACPSVECELPRGQCMWIAGDTGTCK